jgi:hypothetical protein
MPAFKTAPRNVKRFEEQAFRRYEPVIELAIENYPNETLLKLGRLSTETVSHRLRDAARGYHTFRYKSTINFEKFNNVWPQLEIRTDLTPEGEGLIRISANTKTAPLGSLEKGSIPLGAIHSILPFECPNLDCLHAFLTQSTFSVFKSPIRLINLTPELTNYLLTSAYSQSFPHAVVDIRSEDEIYIF